MIVHRSPECTDDGSAVLILVIQGCYQRRHYDVTAMQIILQLLRNSHIKPVMIDNVEDSKPCEAVTTVQIRNLHSHALHNDRTDSAGR